MTLISEMVAANQLFKEQHGGEPLRDPDSGYEVFPDGTERKFNELLNNYSVLEPMQPDTKLRGKRKFVALLLRQEQTAFTTFKKGCMQAFQYGDFKLINVPGPPANATDLLKAGAKRIAKLQENLNQLDREISQLPEELARAAYEEDKHRKVQAARKMALDIQSITY